MDREIKRSVFHKYRYYYGGGTILIILLAALLFSILRGGSRSLRVDEDNLTVATVQRGILHDFIPLHSKVVPRDTIYIDAIDGGSVERVLVNPGDSVTKGQPIVTLGNTQLELQVLEQEGRLAESITQLQQQQVLLEQSRLNNQNSIMDIDYNITRLSRSLERRATLSAHGVSSQEAKDLVQDELTWYQKRRPVQLESNRIQEDLRLQQLPKIKLELETLERDLTITREKLDGLIVRATADGLVTALSLKSGQTLRPGERLAEITPDTGYKLSQDIDEFYLSRVRKGQVATVDIEGKSWALSVDRIYPQVKGGTFTVDFGFSGQAPKDLLPGQAVTGTLALGSDSEATFIPTGPFLERTGGDWIFVLKRDGKSAERRPIKIGRRNYEQVEILSGLKPGDKVVVSDYTALEHAETLNF